MKTTTKNAIRSAFVAALMLYIFTFWPTVCYAARDLSSAAETAVSQVLSLAKILSVLGVGASALIYQIPGAAMFARGTLVGGLIGTGLSFGGPSIIAAFRAIFGG